MLRKKIIEKKSLHLKIYTSFVINRNKYNMSTHRQADSKESKPSVKFTPEEYQRLTQLVEKYGEDWKTIAEHMPNRKPRKCKECWTYHSSPTDVKYPWTKQEDKQLLGQFKYYGKNWKKYTIFNRDVGEIKHRYSFLICKSKNSTPNDTRRILRPNGEEIEKNRWETSKDIQYMYYVPTETVPISQEDC